MLSWNPVFITRNGRARDFAREVADQFDRSFRELTGEAQPSRLTPPRAEVVETKQAVLVHVDLPGHDPAQVQVNLDNNVLTIESERKAPARNGDETVHRAELAYGKYARSFSLPATVDGSRTEAKFDAGVLTITVPKREEAKPRTISVKVSQ